MTKIFQNSDGETGKFILQELRDPNLGTPAFQEMYRRFAKRVLWIDSEMVEGAFQMNTAWYFAVPEDDPVFQAHVHDDCDEIIGFFGSNPDAPYDLGGLIELKLGDETHLIDRTSMIFIPAGLSHNPMSIKRVDRPIFHFSVITKGEYAREDGGSAYR